MVWQKFYVCSFFIALSFGWWDGLRSLVTKSKFFFSPPRNSKPFNSFPSKCKRSLRNDTQKYLFSFHYRHTHSHTLTSLGMHMPSAYLFLSSRSFTSSTARSFAHVIQWITKKWYCTSWCTWYTVRNKINTWRLRNGKDTQTHKPNAYHLHLNWATLLVVAQCEHHTYTNTTDMEDEATMSFNNNNNEKTANVTEKSENEDEECAIRPTQCLIEAFFSPSSSVFVTIVVVSLFLFRLCMVFSW